MVVWQCGSSEEVARVTGVWHFGLSVNREEGNGRKREFFLKIIIIIIIIIK